MFTLNISETVRYRHSFSGILMGTYTRPTQQCHFEWPWVTLIDLAKYSVTRSVARSLCDSWASCFKISCSQIWWQPNEWTNERTDKMRTQCIRLPSVWPAGSIAVRHFTRVPPPIQVQSVLSYSLHEKNLSYMVLRSTDVTVWRTCAKSLTT